jgi:hypothetical protein
MSCDFISIYARNYSIQHALQSSRLFVGLAEWYELRFLTYDCSAYRVQMYACITVHFFLVQPTNSEEVLTSWWLVT